MLQRLALSSSLFVLAQRDNLKFLGQLFPAADFFRVVPGSIVISFLKF